jgi:hypothetical protein
MKFFVSIKYTRAGKFDVLDAVYFFINFSLVSLSKHTIIHFEVMHIGRDSIGTVPVAYDWKCYVTSFIIVYK